MPLLSRLRSSKPLRTAAALAVVTAFVLCIRHFGSPAATSVKGPAAAPLNVANHPASGAAGAPASAADIRAVLRNAPQTCTDWRQFTPAAITIAVEPDLPMTFNCVRVENNADGSLTWVGRNGLRGASLVAIAKRDRWYGVLAMIGGSWDVHVQGDKVQVTEHSQPITCEILPASKSVDPTPLEASILGASSTHTASIATAGDPLIHTSGTTIYNVDTAFYYSPELEQLMLAGAFDGTSTVTFDSPAAAHDYLDSRYHAYIETNNLILEQSKVSNLRWRYLGIFLTPAYTPEVLDPHGYNGSPQYRMAIDLAATEDQGLATGRFVTANNRTLFADQYVLITPGNRDVGGEAETPGHLAGVGFAVGNIVVAHEMGHNFGLHHDRRIEGVANANDGQYNFGYVFDYHFSWFGGVDDPVIVGSQNPNTYGDLMSYSRELPFFSNPDVFLKGNDFASGNITVSDDNLYALGVAGGHTGGADAARTLREGASAMAGFQNDPARTFPAISVQPIARSAPTVGSQLRLGVVGTGTGLSYQWRYNGIAIAGATSNTFTKANAALDDAGKYDVMVSNALGTVISRAAVISVVPVEKISRLVNISTRSPVSTGNDVQIAGFVISGSAPKTVLIRAGSEVLTAAGLQNVLADPTLELHDLHATIATNDDWSSDPTTADAIRTAAAKTGAAAWATGSKDAAILITLNPGLYSAIVAGKSGATGTAIVEVYDVTQEGSKVVNISTRSPVGTGNDVQIAGFVIAGSTPKTVLIRAGSAVLKAAGLTDVLADPVIELHDLHTTIATNDDWASDAGAAESVRAAAAQSGAATWSSGSKDAALVVTLNPGIYSVVVSGKAGGTGAAIVEVYDAE